MLRQVACAEHGLDFCNGVGLAHLQVGQLAVSVGDEVVEQLIEHGGRAAGLDLHRLAQGVEVASGDEFRQLVHQALAAFAVFILAVGQDAFERWRGLVGLGADDVFFDLLVGGQLDVQALALSQAHEGTPGAFAAAQDAFGAVQFVVVVAQRGEHFKAEGVAGLAPGRAVEQAVEFVVGLGIAVAHLGLAAQDFIEHDFGQQACLFCGGNVHMANLAGHVALFVRQKEPLVTVAADQALLLQPRQAFLNLALEGKFVGVDLVNAQGGKVVDVGLDDVGDVANQEHRLEQLAVVRLQGRVERRLVDGALGHAVDEAFDGRIEVVQRHQHVDAVGGVAHGSRLEGVEQ